MASVYGARLDHWGLLASTLRDFGLMSRIDARLVPDEQEEITPGDAGAGMILNGLGFAKRPLSFTPQFFAHTPLDLWWRGGVHAEMCNRFTLGRTLDEVSASGGDLWWSARAVAVCTQAGLDLRFHHLDTTRFALRGDSGPDSDAHAMTIPHGSATDHRPDLPQAVLALMVAQDGGVPWVSKSGEGNASETPMFQERAAARMATLQRAPTPRYLVADAKLSHADQAAHLRHLGCITRMPNTLKRVGQVLGHALRGDTWHRLDETTRSQRIELCHSGMAQRWLVVAAPVALERAQASVHTAQECAADASEQPLLPLHAHRFETPEAAHAALVALETSWRDHQGAL
jgi:transposase